MRTGMTVFWVLYFLASVTALGAADGALANIGHALGTAAGSFPAAYVQHAAPSRASAAKVASR